MQVSENPSSATASQRVTAAASFWSVAVHDALEASHASLAALALKLMRQVVAELNADPTDHAEYELGKFADRAPDEVPRSPTTAERKKSPNECTDPQGCVWGGSCYSCSRFPDFATAIPDHIDWTELGAVTPVHTAGLPTPLARRHPSPSTFPVH